MKQRTLILLKPDCIQRNLVGEITGRFERKGLKIVGMKMIHLDDAVLQEHYSHIADKPFFPEVRDFINDTATRNKVVVATEGYFGTLPDGLLMYFDKSPLIKNIEVFGVGVPIEDIPDQVLERAIEHETYLIVNSHRFFIDPLPDNLILVNEFERPRNGPSLLMFRVLAN